jgi:hypothetical protein
MLPFFAILAIWTSQNFVVSLMTDRETDWLANILKSRKPTEEEINRLSLIEIITEIGKNKIDHTKYDLW